MSSRRVILYRFRPTPGHQEGRNLYAKRVGVEFTVTADRGEAFVVPRRLSDAEATQIVLPRPWPFHPDNYDPPAVVTIEAEDAGESSRETVPALLSRMRGELVAAWPETWPETPGLADILAAFDQALAADHPGRRDLEVWDLAVRAKKSGFRFEWAGRGPDREIILWTGHGRHRLMPPCGVSYEEV